MNRRNLAAAAIIAATPLFILGARPGVAAETPLVDDGVNSAMTTPAADAPPSTAAVTTDE